MTKSPDRAPFPVCRVEPGLVLGAANRAWRMRRDRLIPDIASDPGDQLAGPTLALPLRA